jgi:pimeloyl-ACP methyl ester carboxylesterase
MTPSRPQKSTIVRARNAARLLAFRTADLLAPRLAGRLARDLWFRVPPAPAATALPAGGEAFSVVSRGTTVRGHVYGAGPTVYLVHGWGGRSTQFAELVAPLVAAGRRVVLFDAPSHGDSDAGVGGPRHTHGVEMGRALDAVFARFGPAEAVVAHSLGTLATYLTLRFGWLGTERLALVAPMVEAGSYFDRFQAALGFRDRTRRAFDREVEELVGIPVGEFDALVQAAHVDPVPTLVVHDLEDRQTPHAGARRLVDGLPDARLVTTTGLGHRRILREPTVIAEVVGFVTGGRRAAVA